MHALQLTMSLVKQWFSRSEASIANTLVIMYQCITVDHELSSTMVFQIKGFIIRQSLAFTASFLVYAKEH